MERIKLWAFYQTMAWASLFKPTVGLEMIAAANEGKAKMGQAKARKGIFGLAQVAKRKDESLVDWSKAPKWADRHIWDHEGKGQWLGHTCNDWINTYPMWESEWGYSGIPMPEGWDRYNCVARNEPKERKVDE